jgi:hypothetical protein
VIFSTAFLAYTLSCSTILDSRLVVYLVNITDLIIPKSFIKLTEGEIVNASTKAILVTIISK